MKLAKMKVVEIRKELDARGLDSAGTRPTLMKRLRQALSREEASNPSQQRPTQSMETSQTNQPGNGLISNDNNDRHDPALTESRPTPGREAVDAGESDNIPPATEHITTPSPNTAPATETAQRPRGTKNLASGSIDQSSGISMDERMQKRRERFGATSTAPVTTEEAIQRRQKRFGVVQKDIEKKPAKRRRASNEVDKQALREHEEAKKRRAIKFGISLNTGKELHAENAITADEMEKRRKRQRRFQQVGS